MKTVVDISEVLFRKGMWLADRKNTLFRAMVEGGLRLVFRRHEKTEPYPWIPVTVKGEGLSTEFAESNWAKIRNEIYQDPLSVKGVI